MKKQIIYIVVLLYIAIPVGMFLFNLGNGIPSINPIIDAILLLLLIPVSFIIFFFGFFGGKTGAVIGIIITIGLAVFFIERFFKKPPTD